MYQTWRLVYEWKIQEFMDRYIWVGLIWLGHEIAGVEASETIQLPLRASNFLISQLFKLCKSIHQAGVYDLEQVTHRFLMSCRRYSCRLVFNFLNASRKYIIKHIKTPIWLYQIKVGFRSCMILCSSWNYWKTLWTWIRSWRQKKLTWKKAFLLFLHGWNQR